MTDDKSKTPGMAEVSAKFEHEAEAVVAATPSTDEALAALWQEHEKLRQQHREAIKETDRTSAARHIIERDTPEYRAAAETAEVAYQHQQETCNAIVATQNRMAKMLARTVAGALSKLRVIGVDIADEFKGHDGVLNEASLGSVERLTLSALADLERLAGATAPEDALLVKLADDWYAAHKVFDVASAVREEAGDKAMESDQEAADSTVRTVFDFAGTLAPSPEQASQYSGSSESVMEHLEKYGERCIAAFEAQGWPEKQAEYQRAKQRTDALYEQMVNAPAQGLRGIHAKMRAVVYPDQWETFRIGEIGSLDDNTNPEMFFSLVADIERMAGEGVITRPAASGVGSPQRSPLFSRVSDTEPPIAAAEGAVEALWLLVEDGKLCPDAAEPIAYLVSRLSEHIQEQRRLFSELFIAAGGSAA